MMMQGMSRRASLSRKVGRNMHHDALYQWRLM
jgi:hypothetical protein